MTRKIVLRRSGGYDPKLGPKHPSNRDPTLEPRAMRYSFDDVRAAVRDHWGLSLHRGGEMGDGQHDGRWDVAYSRTGFIVGGQLPGRGHGYVRYETLGQVVESCDLPLPSRRIRKRSK